MPKSIQYNLLSFLAILMAFLFLLLLGQHYGIGVQTDNYFFSLMIVSYLSYFIRLAWDAMHAYYIKEKVTNLKSASQLYSVLLNNIIIISFLIISLYFLLTENLIELSTHQKNFLDIYIFYILFHNILQFNKSILNLEKYFAFYYLVDIFIYILNILTVLILLEDNIKVLAYSMIIGTSIAVLAQFYFIFYKISIKYSLQIKHKKTKQIYKNSIKIQFSSILYDLKEPLLAMLFLSLGNGIYSLFNYANKFAAAIFHITTTPTINRFVTQVHYLVAQQKYLEVHKQIQITLMQTVPVFLIISLMFYLLMPSTMPLFFANTLSDNDLKYMQRLYLYMSLFYFLIAVEAPFTNTITAFKLFNYHIFINILFFIFLSLIYLLFQLTSLLYYNYLFILIFAQFSNLVLYVHKNKIYLNNRT